MNVTACEPRPFEGMRLIEMKMIPVDQITGHNVGRATDAQTTKISAFVRLINEGLYKPFYNEPPTVIQNDDGTFTLNNGFHRLRGHIGADQKEMWCAVVEFDSPSIADLYASVSNAGAEDEEVYVKTDRSDEDIVKIAKKVMQDNGYEATKENAVQVLKELQATNRSAYKNGSLTKKILKTFGVKVETVTTYTERTGMMKYRDITDDTSAPVWQSTFATAKESHVHALRRSFMTSKQTDKPVNVVVNVNQASNSEEIQRVRQRFESRVLKEVQYMKDIVDAMREGTFELPKIVYLPQSEAEIQANELIVSNV